jgi:hypothetical protein
MMKRFIRVGLGVVILSLTLSSPGFAGENGEGEDELRGVQFKDLPEEVQAHIFRFLRPETLGRASCVSQNWNRVIICPAFFRGREK